MLAAEPRSLLRKLNATCTRALEVAAASCVGARHYEVAAEHLLVALLDDRESDVAVVFEHYKADVEGARGQAQRALSSMRGGNQGKPVFSPLLLEWVQDAWVYASTELGESSVRSGALLVRAALAAGRYFPTELSALEALPRDELRRRLGELVLKSAEAAAPAPSGPRAAGATPAAGGAGEGALARFTSDLTERARRGGLDPVFGREAEVRQIIDVLVRRRKNNPLVVGDAGVGKTAIVEGLALRIAEGSVPEALKNVALLTLDLAALQAGAGMRGEFESRLKGVLQEVGASAKPVVLFIDEAHTLIGAGGAQGGGDAANLLKPALARGELRTVAATTWAEFKKYFEKDEALTRRFQPIKVDEPSTEVATLMLRGLVRRFEEAHGVIIADEAVRASVALAGRYLTGRRLPDKAVDLLDTSAARVRISRAAPPPALEDARASLAALECQLEAFGRDEGAGLPVDDSSREGVVRARDGVASRVAELEARLAGQRALLAEIDGHRAALSAGDGARRGPLGEALGRLRALPAEQRLVYADVGEDVVASVVADWTGIPVGRMVRDDVAAVLDLEARLRRRVRGQDDALSLVARELRSARSGLKPPGVPLGVFLLVGPSGVGKTETALAIADLLFGGERFMTVVNMSEFQERHTVSKLVGSPPGYVGYGEGGVLTEAVRQRPYSVVLLDEVEKADPEVLNLFYQVFDKGMLADGEGRLVDFQHSVVVLTSNLATDVLGAACPPGAPRPPLDELVALARPALTAHFKPALLGRMTVVPYALLGPGPLRDIARAKLAGLVRRAAESHRLRLDVDEAVYDAVVARCAEGQSGARAVDRILRGTLMPLVAGEILRDLAEGREPAPLRLSIDGRGEVACRRGGEAS